MTKRRVFYSFHYAADSWRAAQVRNIGVIEGNSPATDNQWEEVEKGGIPAIRKWINKQMKNRSCTLVLVGQHTARRYWIGYEIKRSWDMGMDLVGVRIHGLLNQYGDESQIGYNPFEDFTVCGHFGYEYFLSSVVPCYNPPGDNSRKRYAWIKSNLSSVVEKVIEVRGQYP